MLAIRPPPGAEAMAGWATCDAGWGATDFCGGGGGAARRAVGDGDLPRPNAEPRDGDDDRRAILEYLSWELSFEQSFRSDRNVVFIEQTINL